MHKLHEVDAYFGGSVLVMWNNGIKIPGLINTKFQIPLNHCLGMNEIRPELCGFLFFII